MTSINGALPFAAGGAAGLELGQAAGHFLNFVASVNPEIQPDVTIWVTAIIAPLVGLAAHKLLAIDLDRDGKPDLAPVEPAK